jgi:pimeloyl-ACP methyl ester carboxylesterase
MDTFLFGPGDRLFGAYYEGFGPPAAPPVLICNGLGQDAMRSHLLLRHLARRISAIGGPVLQFDYRGTGDSWGEPDQNTMSEYREDTAHALQELLDISARPRAVILGVRLGAWLALEHGDRVVAWDPILSGADYVATLRTLSRELEEARDDTSLSQQERSTGSPELAGYRYAERLLEELEDLDLERVVRDRSFDRLMLITGGEADRTATLRSLQNHAVDITCLPAKPAHWASASRFERSLTPFPSLTELCETVSRW